MRLVLMTLAIFAASLLVMTSVDAQGKDKEATVKGTITCAKCDLGVSKGCATVIVTKEGGKDVTIWFDGPSHKKYHGDTCTEAKKGTVTGTITTKDDKKTIAVTALKYE